MVAIVKRRENPAPSRTDVWGIWNGKITGTKKTVHDRRVKIRSNPKLFWQILNIYIWRRYRCDRVPPSASAKNLCSAITSNTYGFGTNFFRQNRFTPLPHSASSSLLVDVHKRDGPIYKGEQRCELIFKGEQRCGRIYGGKRCCDRTGRQWRIFTSRPAKYN